MSLAQQKFIARKQKETEKDKKRNADTKKKLETLYLCGIAKAESLQKKGFLVETITKNPSNPMILDYGFKKTSDLKKEVGI